MPWPGDSKQRQDSDIWDIECTRLSTELLMKNKSTNPTVLPLQDLVAGCENRSPADIGKGLKTNINISMYVFR